MSEYYLVDVKSISSNVPRSQFPTDEIETLAQSILDAGGLLSPLLLKQTGAESYQVLAGDRQYYAAVRAKEINPRQAETVNAFVVPEDLTDTAVEQFAALHAPLTPPPTPSGTASSGTTAGDTNQRLTNLESRLDAALQEMKQTQQRETQRLEKQIQTLQVQVPEKVEPLEVFNSAPPAELLKKLAIAGIKGKTASNMITNIEKARKSSPFTSFSDVVSRVQGLADKRMLSILDAWNGLF